MTSRRHLGTAAAIAAAALAAPAVAAAHPSVYTSEAKRYTNGALESLTRYVVTNHGNTVVMTETNGLGATQGVVGFNMVPSGAYRDSRSRRQILTDGGSGAQAHATCLGGTSDLGAPEQVLAWQGGDQAAPTTEQPFWNYVPFQTASANLDDDPALWTPVLTAAGFNLGDLATPASAQAACQAKGGTYRAADTITTTAAALATGLTAPLEHKAGALTQQNATLTSEVGTLTQHVGSLTTQLAAARTDIASLMLKAAPMKLTLGKVTASGTTATVSAPPLSLVTVRLSLSAAQVKKLGLRSTQLARKTATTAADGTATLTLKPSRAISRKLKGSPTVVADAISGDRFATAKSKLTR